MALVVRASPSIILKEGFLFKKGGIMKSWSRRYCVLSHQSLCYFRSEDHDKLFPLGRIFLSDIVSISDEGKEKKKAFVFVLHTKKRAVLFQAANDEDREKWIQEIQKSLQRDNEAEKTDPFRKSLRRLTPGLRRVTLVKDSQKGIGCTIKNTAGRIFVYRILEDGPIAETGILRPGDEILDVHGVTVSGLSVSEVVEVIRNAPVEFLATVKPVNTSAHRQKEVPSDVMYADIVHNDTNGFQGIGPVVERRASPQMINSNGVHNSPVLDHRVSPQNIMGSPRNDRKRPHNATSSPMFDHRVGSPLNDHRSSPPVPPRASKLPLSSSANSIDDIDGGTDHRYAVVKEPPKKANGYYSSESSPELLPSTNLNGFSYETQPSFEDVGNYDDEDEEDTAPPLPPWTEDALILVDPPPLAEKPKFNIYRTNAHLEGSPIKRVPMKVPSGAQLTSSHPSPPTHITRSPPHQRPPPPPRLYKSHSQGDGLDNSDMLDSAEFRPPVPPRKTQREKATQGSPKPKPRSHVHNSEFSSPVHQRKLIQ